MLEIIVGTRQKDCNCQIGIYIFAPGPKVHYQVKFIEEPVRSLEFLFKILHQHDPVAESSLAYILKKEEGIKKHRLSSVIF